MNDATTLTPMQRFWRLLKPDRQAIRNVYAYSVFGGLINLSLPLGIQAIINLIQGGQVNTSWVVLVLLVVGGVTLTGVMQIYQLRITETLQQNIFTRASFDFAFRIPRIKMEALYRHYAPELMNRFFDVMSVQKGLSKILIDFSAASLQVIFGLVLLSIYHPFFIAFSLVLVASVWAIFRFTAKKGLNTSLEESKFKYEVAHWLEELARTSSTFKLSGKCDLHLKRTDSHVANYLEARDNHFKVLVQQYSLMVWFKTIVAAGLLVIGGILVMNQQMNIGQFVAAEIIILLVMNSVEKLVLSLETIYDVLTALEKIGQVTDLELEASNGSSELTNTSNGMELDLHEVVFRYPGQEMNILNGVNLKVERGENVFITGANGSGKSTLLRMIAGLYDPLAGHISYNGYVKGNLDVTSLRSAIGDCLSEEQLFQGTLLENITMGSQDIRLDEVKEACESLGLMEFVQELSNGFNTVIEPAGRRFPRSVVQKLLLARSVVHKPGLLLLEDAFEHINLKEHQKVIDFLTDEKQPWTLIAVSASPYLARRSDTIVWMEAGRIVQKGTFEEMKSNITFNT